MQQAPAGAKAHAPCRAAGQAGPCGLLVRARAPRPEPTPRVLEGPSGPRHRRCSTPSAAGLATYSLVPASPPVPSTRGVSGPGSSGAHTQPALSSHWLARAAPQLVQALKLDKAQQVFSVVVRPHVQLRTVASAARPQSWAHLSSAMANGEAEGLVLARPIASPSEYCPLAASSASTAAGAAGPSCRPAPAPKKSSARAAGACAATYVPEPPSAFDSVTGSVDEGCCSGGEQSQDHAAAAAGAHQHRPPRGSAQPEASASPGDVTETQYYGLVVQSRGGGGPGDGCYVLKLCSSTSVGCTCTHYVLTHVCQGQPLEQQLRDAWLTQASRQPHLV